MFLKVGDQCPSCKDGKMQTKEGRYGVFLACDMYRHTGCNFIAKTDSQGKDELELRADEILRQNNKEFLII